MELSPAREKIIYQEHIFTERAVSEESTETIVPDALPDIARLIGTDAEVFVRGKDADGGKVTVHGVAKVAVLYAPDEEIAGINRVAPEIPFSVSLADAKINAGTRVVVRVWAENTEAVMINPRKISTRVTVCAMISCYNETIVEIPTAQVLDDGGEIETLSAETEVGLPCDVREKTLVITDETAFPPSTPALREILTSRCSLITEETKVVGSKLIAKGAAHTDIIYVSPDGEAYAASFKTEFSQILELEKATAESEFEIVPILTGTYVEPVSGAEAGQQRISIEIHAVYQLVATSAYKVQYLADAYSTRFDVETQNAPVSLKSRGQLTNTPAVVRGMINTEGAVRVVSVTARVISIETSVVSGGETEARAIVAATGLYVSQDGVLRAASVKLEASAAITQIYKNIVLHAETGRDIYGVTADGGIEIRVPVDFATYETGAFDISPVSALKYDENTVLDMNTCPSLVIARAKSGDTLWSVAKRYRATRDMVREVNALSDDIVVEGAMLVVPKKRS